MKERTTAPALTLPEDAPSEQHDALREFYTATTKAPEIMLGALALYGTPEDTQPSTRQHTRAARAIGSMILTKADIESKPDPDTATAMRKGLEAGIRKSNAEETVFTPEQRRTTRLAAFVTEHIAWAALHPSAEKKPRKGRTVVPFEQPQASEELQHQQTKPRRKRTRVA